MKREKGIRHISYSQEAKTYFNLYLRYNKLPLLLERAKEKDFFSDTTKYRIIKKIRKYYLTNTK